MRRASTRCRCNIIAEGLDEEVLKRIRHRAGRARRRSIAGTTSCDRLTNPEGEVTIGVVGKYVGLQDAYKSLNEALVHGGIANRVKVNIRWIDAELFEKRRGSDVAAKLEPMHAILVPGGFGERGAKGKIASVRFARERDVPFFGICLGMQMACIEGARDQRASANASHHRIRPDRRAGGRHDHRMDDRRGHAEARGRRRSGRHDAAGRL